eukprot:scaffold315611_cov50-Prasinocladus_malaysianus.AAC.1
MEFRCMSSRSSRSRWVDVDSTMRFEQRLSTSRVLPALPSSPKYLVSEIVVQRPHRKEVYHRRTCSAILLACGVELA